MALHTYAQLLKAEQLKNKKEKIEFLRSNRHPTIDKLLQLTYSDKIEFELPDTEPPYKPSEFDEPNNLHAEIRRIERVFVKGTLPGFAKVKRESQFIQLLEYVDKDDAKLLVGMIKRKLPFKSLTKELVKEALPELFA